MNRIRVKICGIKELDNALKAIECGADAIGFVFYDKSPRFIEKERATELIRQLPAMVNKVGVFVNHTIEEILKFVEIGIDTIQLHGETSFYDQDFVFRLKERTKLPIIYALRVERLNDELISTPFVKEIDEIVSNFLMDKLDVKGYGGTGQTLVIEGVKDLKYLKEKIILAGGINEKNIKDILSKVKPYAIDISSGVEREKGIKDNSLIENFFKTFTQYSLYP
ncbi:MAG: phosphoribosylanthranilate isomerase [Brevinematales bacterium]|nr:phosphoribosylanthranilate isomerase [Brevinematales bacterium]